jgi:DNA polymerase III subunit beta
MKLVIIKGNLREALGIVERASTENATLPILKNVLFEAENNKLKLTATNLEIAVTCAASGKVTETGKLTISNIPSERLNLETKDNSLKIQTDNYQATIQGLPADDFPLVPKIKNLTEYIEIKATLFKDALAQIISSAQYSELRPELSSVLLDYSLDQLKIVTTDSFRLSEKNIPSSQFKSNHAQAFKILVPVRTAQELLRVLQDDEMLRVFHDNHQILFQTDQLEFISRLIDGMFPDYNNIGIPPKSFETEVWLDRQELMNALKLAGVFSSKVSEVKIKIPENKKSLEVFSTDQSGENNYVLQAKVQGKPKEISFNWRYLLDGLKALKTEDVFWGINEENKPSLLKSPNEASYFYVLMPILKS